MKIRMTALLSMLFVVGFGQQLTLITPVQKRILDSIATQDVPKGAPGIATGIVSRGKIIYEQVAGYADLGDSTLISRNSRFNIASNGKQFTALAVLVLLDQQKLKLRDDIRRYLPNLYPNLSSSITVEHLLTHTSGIRDVYDLWSLQGITWWKQSFGNKEVMALVEQQQDLNFAPGSKYLYSNTNYILLTAIVEKITGTSFIDFTNQLFRQLGMPNTSFEFDHTKIKGPMARAYFNFDTWKNYNWTWNVYGDGNIFSTLADQLQWELVIQGKKTKIKRRLVEKSQQLTERSLSMNYGYGLEFSTYKGLPYTFHEGATGAWKATVIRFPNKAVSIVTLTNTGKATPNTQTRQMADIVLDLKSNANYIVTQPAQTGELVSEDVLIGVYQTENNFTFQFEQKDNALYLKRMGRNDIKLEREAANIWHQTNDPAFKQEFKKNAKGEMTVTAYYTSHDPYTLTKINSDWSGFNFQKLNGSFLNTETGVTITIAHTSEKNYTISFGNKTSAGLLISPSKMLVNNYVLAFEDTGATPGSLLLSGERIERVKFIRTK